MLAAFLIVFREVFEAGLIVGIVMAAMQGVEKRGRWIAAGIGSGLLGAALLACFAGALSNAFSGNGQEIFTATVLIIATCMLGWHNFWMASHGREIAQQMKHVGKAVVGGEKSMAAMAVVVAIAVLREGAEVVMFLYGVVMASHEGFMPIALGSALGLVIGSIISYLLYRGLVAIPMKHFFTVTNWMIAFLAAGMAGQAAATLAGADLIPSMGYEIWNSSSWLPESGMLGKALHALVGYSDRPTGVQLLTYLVVLSGIIVGMRIVHKPQKVTSRG